MRASCLAFCISRLLGESIWRRNSTSKGAASKRPATASGCGGAGPSAASPLLPDARWHRLRRGSWHPTPRRSQRRSTPFFSNLSKIGYNYSMGKVPEPTAASARERSEALQEVLAERVLVFDGATGTWIQGQ